GQTRPASRYGDGWPGRCGRCRCCWSGRCARCPSGRTCWHCGGAGGVPARSRSPGPPGGRGRGGGGARPGGGPAGGRCRRPAGGAGVGGAGAGGMPGDDRLRLAGGAAGTPLYLTELVAALARSSSVTIPGAGTAELTNRSAPSSLSAAIADRLGFVPAPVREVLRAAALLGVDFAVPDLAIVLGCGVAELIPAIDEARAAGVLAESGNALGFRH